MENPDAAAEARSDVHVRPQEDRQCNRMIHELIQVQHNIDMEVAADMEECRVSRYENGKVFTRDWSDKELQRRAVAMHSLVYN
jgi:hypothetical protein